MMVVVHYGYDDRQVFKEDKVLKYSLADNSLTFHVRPEAIPGYISPKPVSSAKTTSAKRADTEEAPPPPPAPIAEPPRPHVEVVVFPIEFTSDDEILMGEPNDSRATHLAGIWRREDGAALGSTDLDKLQGTWNVITMSGDESDANDDPTKVTFSFKGDTVTISHKDHLGQSAMLRFVLGPSTKPKHIDFAPPSEKLKPSLGIYNLDEDDLSMCLGTPDCGRPTAFITQRKATLFTLKRAKNE